MTALPMHLLDEAQRARPLPSPAYTRDLLRAVNAVRAQLFPGAPPVHALVRGFRRTPASCVLARTLRFGVTDDRLLTVSTGRAFLHGTGGLEESIPLPAVLSEFIVASDAGWFPGLRADHREAARDTRWRRAGDR